MNKILIIFAFYSSFSVANPINSHIIKTAREHNIPAALIMSLISIESNYDERAVSKAGAVGLMQLMPKTAKRFDVKDSYDGIQNVTGGIKYLKFLVDRYGYYKYALAAYNAGENAVDRYKGIPPYKETMAYVKKVEKLFKEKTGRGLSTPEKFRVINSKNY